MVYSEIVTSKTPFLEVTYPEIDEKKPRLNIFHINRRIPERRLFIKSFNEKEFIGEEICRIRGFRSAHYFLVGVNSNSLERYRRTNYYGNVNNRNYVFYVGSYDFREPNKEYFDLSTLNLGEDGIEQVLSMCPNTENKKELLHEILELLALDVFMGQEDRCAINVMMEKSRDGSLHLAPLYDFQYSINFLSIYYLNNFKSFRFTRDYYEFMEQYGEFRDLLEFYSDEDLYTITENALKKHSMKIPEHEQHFLKQFSNGKRKQLKRILQ